MDQDKFIWCRNCGEIHPMSLFDKAPEYMVDQGEEIEVPMDDWGAFMRRHAGHKLQALRGIGKRYHPNDESWDPMMVEYIEATNGREWFVVRSSRERIEDPLKFDIVPGRLKYAGACVNVRENEIRKEMKHHFSFSHSISFDEERIELFIKILKEVVKEISLHKINGHRAGPGSLASRELMEHLLDRLSSKCASHFGPAELNDIRRFCKAEIGDDGVLSLQIKRQYRIEQAA